MSILLLPGTDVRRLLPMRDCIAALGRAFGAPEARAFRTGILGAHVANGGFHVKTAGMSGARPYFAAKVNANFPSNPARNGLPTVQGVLILFDALCGRPLAIMDSAEVTRVRTASASALAARYLARSDARTLAVIGCGVQGRAHVEAMRAVRPIGRVVAYDRDDGRADAFARDVRLGEGLEVVVASTAAEAARAGEIVVTCTSATEPILFAEDLRPGTFVAAVGADAEQKQEIHPALMRRAVVVCDVREQCATIGDLHHALSAGTMMLADVAADLTELVAAGGLAGADGDAVRIFDSTGTALEDVAAAAIVYERASTLAATWVIDLVGKTSSLGGSGAPAFRTSC